MRRKAFQSAETFFMSLRQLMATTGDKLVDPWSQNWAVRAAVGNLYRVVRGVPFVGWTGDRNRPKEAARLGDNDPLSLLCARPNPIQSGGEFVASLVAYQMIDGVGYVVLYGKDGLWTRDTGDVPREMLPADPRVVTVRTRDPRSGLVTEYEMGTASGVPMLVPAESVVVVRDFNPRDLQAGSSPLAPVWSAMEADRLMDAFSSALLNNGASPGLVVKLKADPSASQKAALREAFDDRHKGASKAGRTAVIGPDVDVSPFPATNAKDMEASASRDRWRDAVKAVLGVTDYEVGKFTDYSLASAQNAARWLWTNTILPTLSGIEDKLWAHVFEPLSRGQRTARWAGFDLSEVGALRPDMIAAAPAVRTLVETGYDPDQVSAAFGLTFDYEEPPEPEPEPVAAPTPPEAKPEAKPPEPEANTKRTPHIWVRKAPRPKPLPRHVAIRLQREWSRHAERRLGVAWRRFTAKRYAETVRLVRNVSDLGAFSAESVLGDVSAWRSGAEAAARKGLDSGRTLVDNFGDELALRIDVDDNALKAAAARRVGQMVNVGTKLRTTIRDSIARSLQGGETLEDLEKIVGAKFGGRLPSNAATVARTETQIFAADVRHGLMVQQGVDEHEWSAAMDQWTRETHRAVDGQRVAVGTRFSNGLLHPLESGAPASEVVNCRCVALPYMREIED